MNKRHVSKEAIRRWAISSTLASAKLEHGGIGERGRPRRPHKPETPGSNPGPASQEPDRPNCLALRPGQGEAGERRPEG